MNNVSKEENYGDMLRAGPNWNIGYLFGISGL